MSNKVFAALDTAGGSNGSLDEMLESTLTDGDIAIVIDADGKAYFYRYESSDTTAESDPEIIRPNDYTGGTWMLASGQFEDLKVYGDAVVDGTLTLGGALDVPTDLTCATLNVNSSTEIDGVLDEDDFASDSDTAVPTQQSTKAYIGTVLAAASFDLLAGFLVRPQFTWSDVETITLTGFRYHHNGTVEQIVKNDTTLTFVFGSGGSNAGSDDLGADEWHYLYLDDSAIVTEGTNVISETELINSTTAPTWDADQLGWYNGKDRCIAAFYSNADSELDEFFHTDSLISYSTVLGTSYAAYPGTTFAATWTATAPTFCTMPYVGCKVHPTNTTGIYYAYYKPNGSSWTGHIIGYGFSNGKGYQTFGTLPLVTDSSQTIQIKVDRADANAYVYLYSYGYYLQRGM